MGKKHKANNKKSDGKLTRRHARGANASAPVNRITGIPAALPLPSSTALSNVRPERTEKEVASAVPRVPTHPGLVRLCQFLRDRAGAAIGPVPKKS